MHNDSSPSFTFVYISDYNHLCIHLKASVIFMLENYITIYWLIIYNLNLSLQRS